jgi:hypothetical protein
MSSCHLDVPSEESGRQRLSAWQRVRRRVGKQWRRFGSPSCLLLALILFPLPWVEIQCTARKKPAPATTFLVSNGVQKDMAERLVPWEQETQIWFTQSGLQAALGVFTPHLEKNDPEAIKELGDQVTWSPLMVFFPIAVIIGVAAGLFLLESHRWRRRLLLGCILTALALMLAQSLAGFPLERGFSELMRREARQGKPHRADEPSWRIRYTIWLDLTIISLGAALAPFVADWYGKRRQQLASRG